jgi:hypothetical protein
MPIKIPKNKKIKKVAPRIQKLLFLPENNFPDISVPSPFVFIAKVTAVLPLVLWNIFFHKFGGSIGADIHAS